MARHREPGAEVADLTKHIKRWSPVWAKEVARRGARTYGSMTSRQRPLPDYLIIGTKRGGTTSLWRNLLRHPQVVSLFPAAENVKSPHFFDIHWERGEQWYRSYFPTTSTRQRRANAHQLRTVVGDASPYYMFHPLAPERVARLLPDARLIVALRNPTDRAYSHYQERRAEGTEPLSFRAALAAEATRLAGEEDRIRAERGYYSQAHDFASYLARGRYLEHLDPWLGVFDPAQLLILRSEDFYADPHAVLTQVFMFLGIEPDPPGLALSHLNRLPAPDLHPSTRAWLDDYFRPHVHALEARLDRSFGWNL